MNTQANEGQLTRSSQTGHTRSMSESSADFLLAQITTAMGAGERVNRESKAQSQQKTEVPEKFTSDIDSPEFRGAKGEVKGEVGEWIKATRASLIQYLPIQERARMQDLPLGILIKKVAENIPKDREGNQYVQELAQQVKELSRKIALLRLREGYSRKDEEGGIEKLRVDLQEARIVLDRQTIARKIGERDEAQFGGSTAIFTPEILIEFSQFVTGAQVVEDKGILRFNIDGKEIFAIPKNATVDQVVSAVRSLIKSGVVSERVLEGLRTTGLELQDGAIFMEGSSLFSSESITFLYNCGKQIERLANNPSSMASDKRYTHAEIQELAREQGNLTEERENEIFLNLLMGKRSVGLRREDGSYQRTPYSALFIHWQRSESGKEWLQNHKETTADQILGAYDNWLITNKRKITRILSRFIEKGLLEEDGTGRIGEATRRAAGEIPLFVQVEQFRELFENETNKASSGRTVARAVEAGRKEEGTLEQKLTVMTGVFQPEKAGTLKDLPHIPKKVLEQIGQGEGSFEAGCAVLSTIAKEAYEKEGFIVLPHLSSNHVNLIVAKRIGNKWEVFEVDPSIPKDSKGKKPVVNLSTESPKLSEEIIKQLEKHGKDKSSVEGVRLTLKVDGKTHVISGGDRVLVSAFLTNIVASDKENRIGKETKIALLKEAVRVCPDNAVAYKYLAKLYGEESPQGKHYEARAKNIDPNVKAEVIGAWGDNAPPEVAGVMGAADSWIAAAGGTGPDALNTGQLETIIRTLQTALNQPSVMANQGSVDYIQRHLSDATTAYQQKTQGGGPEGNRIPFFSSLTRNEMDLLISSPDEAKIEIINPMFEELALSLNPGGRISETVLRNAQGRFDEAIRALRATKSVDLVQSPQFIQYWQNKYGHPPTQVDAETVLQNNIKYIEGIQSGIFAASEVARLVESYDAKEFEGARTAANNLDPKSGLQTMTFIASLNGYGPGAMVIELSRVMNEIRVERGGFIEADIYKEELPRRVIEQQYQMAARGVGRYAKYVQQGLSEQAVRDKIKIDVNLAGLIFRITGEASAVAMRGEWPQEGTTGGIRDIQSEPFKGSQLRNAIRYEVIPHDGRVILDRFLDQMVIISLRDTYGDTPEGKAAIRAILKDPKRLKEYRRQIAFYKLATPASFFWEGQVTRTRKMLDVSRRYLSDVYDWDHGTSGTTDQRIIRERDTYSRGFGLFEQLYTANMIFSPGHQPKPGENENTDYYDPELTKDAHGKERNTFEKREYLWTERIAQIFPEVAMEALFNYPDAKTGHDSRFINFFRGSGSAFLDSLPNLPEAILNSVKASSSQEREAMIRYLKFQYYVKPVIAQIRSANINNWPPRQTNFGQDGAYTGYFDRVFGQGFAVNMQRMMGQMSSFIVNERAKNPLTGRQTTIVHDLSYSPIYEQIYRSPLTLDDMPWYFIQGVNPNDPQKRENLHPLDQRLGANNGLGRWVGDEVFLDDSRQQMVDLVTHFDPNNIEGNVGKMEKALVHHREFYGPDAGMASETAVMGTYLRDMIPGLSEFFGMESLPLLGENTEMRRIYETRFINAMNKDQLYQLYATHIRPHLDGKRLIYFEHLLKISRKRRNIRRGMQVLCALLFAYIFETFGATNEAINQEMTGGTIAGK